MIRQYNRLSNASIIFQKYFRGRFVRCKLKKEHVAARIVQQAYRDYCERKKLESARYNVAVSCIQLKWRACMKAREVQTAYHRKKSATIKIQSYFRMYLAFKKFKEVRKLIVALQANCRRFLIGKQYAEALNEQSTRIKEHHSARVIQSLWRGYKVRKSQHKGAIIMARQRIMQIKGPVEESRSIHHRLPSLVEQLLQSKYLSTAASILSSLGM